MIVALERAKLSNKKNALVGLMGVVFGVVVKIVSYPWRFLAISFSFFDNLDYF